MGHFEEERDRLRAAMRARYPITAAAVDACRRRGCAVEVVYAAEDGNERGSAGAFVEAWNEAGEPWAVELHRMFTRAQADERRRVSRETARPLTLQNKNT